MYISKNIEQQVKQIDFELQSPSIKSSQRKNDIFYIPSQSTII